MDRTRIRAFTRMQLGETASANSTWNDTEIDDMINDAQRTVAMDIPEAMLTYRSVTTVSGTQSYQLAEDFMQLVDVELDRSSTQRRTLREYSVRDFKDYTAGNYSTLGQPAIFKLEIGAVTKANATQIPGDIWLYPVPDDNGGSNYTLRYRYYQTPTDLSSDADVPELPVYAHKLICYMAALDLLGKTGNQKKINNVAGKYELELRRVKRVITQNNRHRIRGVTDAMGYDTPGYETRSRRGRIR